MPVPVIGPLYIYILPSSINANSITITVDSSSTTFNSSISGEYLLLETHSDYNWNDIHTVNVSCDGYSPASGTTDTDGKVYITLQQVIYVSKLSNSTTTYTIKDANAYHTGDLATVATSGSYNDLTNKPTVDQTYNSTSTNAQSGTAVAGAVADKLDKTDLTNRLYGTNSSGVQYLYNVTSAATASTVAYRSTGGTLQVGAPTANSHATTKQYVDNLVSTDYALQIIDY